MRLRRPSCLRSLARNERGAAMVEFAMVAPAFLLALMGIFDMSYNIYTASLLEGSIQKAARDATIEGNSATVDNRVTSVVRSIVPDATLAFSRRSYTDYANVAQPEEFTDLNNDGNCNAGEPFADANSNGRWDADRGSTGQGNARDAVLYEVTVSFDRMFPMSGFVPGMTPQVSTVARTVLRNQPYGEQMISSDVGNCT